MAMPKRRIILPLLAATLFGAAIFAGTIEANVYFESTQFCANTCHVMYPEKIAHSLSPHANVDCGHCHIKEGLAGFLRAKLVDGTREVYSLWTHSYESPIPTPLHHQMPARDMCERCHWPEKFYGQRLISLDRYDSDIPNTHRRVQLLLNTGGGTQDEGGGRGIHWHILNKVRFGYLDKKRQDIPWVTVTRDDGTEDLYLREGETAEVLDRTESREMDCIDCHNRATHRIEIPNRKLDRYLALGRIDASLPEIKRLALSVVNEDYASGKEAREKISQVFMSHYEAKWPKIAVSRADAIATAVEATAQVFETTRFPFMNLSWSSHPDNIGHREFPGCFRCHDGKHVRVDASADPVDPADPADPTGTNESSGSGREDKAVIAQDCGTCHQMLGEMREDDEGRLVPKPFLVSGETHADEDCTTCHVIHGQQYETYDVRPERAACLECHEDESGGENPAGFVEGAPHSSMPCYECHAIHYKGQDPGLRCARCHGDVAERAIHEVHLEEDLSCDHCHLPHAFTPTVARVGEKCLECHGDLDVKEALRRFAE
jgi:hypothetical protein